MPRPVWAVNDVHAVVAAGGPDRRHPTAAPGPDVVARGRRVRRRADASSGRSSRARRSSRTRQLPRPEPGQLDPPERLDAFLDAVRWGAVASADSRALQAPFRSGITIEDYQLDPVVRALAMPRVNLLIADDVGLGKTIEAGLVVQELLLRHRARTVLVVCPAGLCVKWQRGDARQVRARVPDRRTPTRCASSAASAASGPTCSRASRG